MLTELQVQNFLIIESLSVSFKEGFNVITGETGSGKSIILDCISIVLGDRASPNLIRSGQERAIISCIFKIKNINLIDKLYENCFLESKQEDSIIIKKIITKNGSRILINDKPTTTSFVNDISVFLIEINSQFEQSSLCFASNYQDILDEFCGNANTLKALKTSYLEYKGAKDNLEQTIAIIKKIQQEEDYYIDILKEFSYIQKAKITNQLEYENLIKKRDSYLMGEKISSKIEDIYGKVSTIKNSRKFDQLSSDLGSLREIITEPHLLESCDQMIKMIDEVSINIDTSFDIFSRNFLQLSFDKEDLENAEEAISSIKNFARKYRTSPELIFDFAKDIELKLKQIEQGANNIEELQKVVSEKLANYKEIEKQVSESRKNNALILEERILQKLGKLNMPNAKFKIFFEEKEPSESGSEAISFKVAMNGGFDFTQLNKCASGGEMSRFMLAFKTVLAEKNETSALIFDEIDTGVSGKVAFNIGVEMRNLSKKTQIICITHNTQVAACAEHHFLVAKKNFEHETKTALKELNQEEKVNVIAYMLSNGQINEDNLKNAKNLMQEAQGWFESKA